MARVTVKDCLEEIPDGFELVVLAAERAKHIASGAPITIDRKDDKGTVFALREIAAGSIDIDFLREGLVSKLQKSKKVDVILEENLYAEAQESINENNLEIQNDEASGMFSSENIEDTDLETEIKNSFNTAAEDTEGSDEEK